MLSIMLTSSRVVVVVSLTVGLLFGITLFSHLQHSPQWTSRFASVDVLSDSRSQSNLVKPENMTISGMVFFGRRDRIRAMHCYVERNLVDNGGWLDEVRWFANTDDEDDLAVLDTIIERSPRYRKIELEEPVGWPDYTKLWRGLNRGTMYIKLDDDIVWLADDAIPRMVTTKLANPDAFAVSANVINAPPLSFLHFHHGALHPYLPDVVVREVFPAFESEEKDEDENEDDDEAEGEEEDENEDEDVDKNEDEDENEDYREKRDEVVAYNASKPWRSSDYPYWSGPSDFEWDLDREPPSDNHRWLRLQDDKALVRTPVSKLTYAFWGPSYVSWAIAAQQHYSLLENIETDNLDAYRFHPPWNMRGERIRINCLTILGDDILDTDVDNWPDNQGDEDMIALNLPKDLQRHILVEGGALAAHFSFYHQGDISKTDLLSRYQAMADENACLSPL